MHDGNKQLHPWCLGGPEICRSIQPFAAGKTQNEGDIEVGPSSGPWNVGAHDS